MKFYLFLCLLLAPFWTNATVQITASVEIAPQLHVTNYILAQSGAYYVTGNCLGGWTNSLSYAFSETYAGGTNLGFGGNSQGSYVGQLSCSPCGPIVVYDPQVDAWTESWVEDGTGIILDGGLWGATTTGTTTGTTITGTDTFTNTDVGLQWGWENANYSASAPLQGGSETISRTVATILKLQTGGRTGSKLQNVIGLYASVQQVAPMFVQTCWVGTDPATICGVTTLTNGPVSIQTNYLRILPDNANIVVAPSVSGLSDYTFSLTPTKYHCYLDIYVYQPYPDSEWAASPLNVTDFQLLGEGGHAMWSFETEIPSAGLASLPASERNLLQPYNGGGPLGAVPGIPCGFWPNMNSTNSGYLGEYPGQMHVPDTDIQNANMMRRFYISYPGFLQGLGYTIGLSSSPPEYSFFLPAGDGNCVNQTCLTAYQSGLPNDFSWSSLPNAIGDVAPQTFGVDLYEMYPGPWISDTPYYPISSPIPPH